MSTLTIQSVLLVCGLSSATKAGYDPSQKLPQLSPSPLPLASHFWASCLSVTKPTDRCHSPSESLLHKRFFWTSKWGIFLQCWPFRFFSNDCHRYGRHFPFQKPCLAHQGTLLPLTLVLGKYKYHLFLPFCLSSLLLSFLWWIFTASLGAELTSAQVITGHNHSQIRHSMYGAQARDPEIHRITSRFLSNQYSQVSPVDQQWPGTLVS